MNLTKHRQAIERMYTDRCTISRPTKSKDPTTKETKLLPVQIYADQPCRLSQKQQAQNGQTEAQNDVRYESKLFISPELDIRQGDEIEVTRGHLTAAGWMPIAAPRQYQAGEPFPYPTHQEISLQRRDYA